MILCLYFRLRLGRQGEDYLYNLNATTSKSSRTNNNNGAGNFKRARYFVSSSNH